MQNNGAHRTDTGITLEEDKIPRPFPLDGLETLAYPRYSSIYTLHQLLMQLGVLRI